MRTGGYTLHQSLTLEAAAVVKQAVGLARRRGHAQVTPLHVASAMLASSTGLLKRACLQSHSHPLQCKALELCFNVALNRLPTSASSPLLGLHAHLPSLSNALVAAFKRAQANQRRGSIENQQQQQPVLALKVEIEQLVISILDDPSVSRVMREAGFSSTQVKANVEQAVSLEKCSDQSQSKELFKSKTLVLENQRAAVSVFDDDVVSVLEAMMSRQSTNSVIVSQHIATAESLVRGVIEKFDKKDVPSNMKFVQFISIPLLTLRNVSREEFQVKLGELRSLVRSYICQGVVLYLGNLDWISDFWSKYGEQRNASYCPVEYMVMELSRLILGESENRRLWLMGIANFQTYEKCKTGKQPLEALWRLQPLKVPVTSLALGLSLNSGMHHSVKEEDPANDFNWLLGKKEIMKQLVCCSVCSLRFKKEAQSVIGSKQELNTSASTSRLPAWLQLHIQDVDQEFDKLKDLCKKWNSICTSAHGKPHFLEKIFTSSSPSSSSTSVSSSDQNKSKLHHSLRDCPMVFQPCRAYKQHSYLHDNDTEVCTPHCSSYLPVAKPELRSNPSSSPNSASSSEANEDMEILLKFREMNPDNYNILCRVLGNKVPWQKDIIPDVVSTILRCRSGMRTSRRREMELTENGEESWLFFLGADSDGKETIAREIAKTIFGSYDNFISISSSNFSTTRDGDSAEEISNKRQRNDNSGSLYDRYSDAVRDNPSRVFYVQDIDSLDHYSLKCFTRAIQTGCVGLADGQRVLLKDAIVIFSSESFNRRSRAAASPHHFHGIIQKEDDDWSEGKEGKLLDLNIAAEDCDENENSASGILDLVDKQVVFKIQAL